MAQQAQIDAAVQIGQAAARVELERQPAECAEDWDLLPVQVGDNAVVVIRRYEAYVLGPINERAQRCWWFNEHQRRGLAGAD